MKKYFLLGMSFMLLAISAEAFNLGLHVQEIKLNNGMKWLLVSRPDVPVFSAAVIVKAGGLNEVPGKTGLAHMFEHMAFKGSPDLDKKEIWSSFLRNGAKEEDLNAYTTKDETVYQASLPESKFVLWAYVTSEMILRPTFNEFYKERDVVMEERRMRTDNNPLGFMLEKLVELAYPSGPYRAPVIGKPEDIQGLTVEDAKAFHEKYYHPNNMVGVLVGDLKSAEIRPVLEQYFGRFPQVPVDVTPKNPVIPPGEKRETISFAAEPFLIISFHKPNAPHEDDTVFDLINELLCTGRTAQLFKKLVQEDKLLSGIWCEAGFPGTRLPNLFSLGATPMKGVSLEKIEAAILQELDKFKNNLVAQKDLDKVRRRLQSDLLWSLENNMALGQMLGLDEVTTGRWQYLVEYPEKIAKITPAQIQKVARHYFVPENRIVMKREKK